MQTLHLEQRLEPFLYTVTLNYYFKIGSVEVPVSKQKFQELLLIGIPDNTGYLDLKRISEYRIQLQATAGQYFAERNINHYKEVNEIEKYSYIRKD